MMLDMHVHSTFSSDGRATPRQILKQARKIGLGGLAITDHNALKGNAQARRIASDFGVLVIRGMEISSTKGHILGYGIDQPVPKDLEPQEVIDRIHAQGGIAVIAHPHRPWSGIGEEIARSISPDAIEVQNAHSTRKENQKALALCIDLGLPMTAGSDSHELGSLGKAHLLVSHVETEEQALDAILKARVRPRGANRSRGNAIKDRTDTVLQWMGRGFKKM